MARRAMESLLLPERAIIVALEGGNKHAIALLAIG